MTTSMKAVSAAPIPQGVDRFTAEVAGLSAGAYPYPHMRDDDAGKWVRYTDHAAALAASEARADVAEEVGRRMTEHVGHYLQRAEAAEQSLAEARKDAERWRWLRGNVWAGWMRGEGFFLNCDEPETEWDAAIDALLPKGEHREH